MLDQNRVSEVIEELRGTCQDIADVVSETEMLDVPFLQAIDAELFRCAACDWWCESCEACVDDEHGHNPDEPICGDCCFDGD